MNRRGIAVHGCHRTQCLSQLSVRLPASLRRGTPRCRAGLILAAVAADKTWSHRSRRAWHVLTPTLSDPRTWTSSVSLYERINLALNLEWQRVRHPYPSHVPRQKRSTVAEQRSVGVHETEVVERDVQRAVLVRRLVPTRSDSYPREPASNALATRIRVIHADTHHGIVVPRTALSHAVVHSEDAALARITSMRSTIDEHSQRPPLLNQRRRFYHPGSNPSPSREYGLGLRIHFAPPRRRNRS